MSDLVPTYLILLHNKHYLTELIIRHVHNTSMHVGVNHTLANVRRNYWVIQGRKTVKKIVGRCIRCNKHEAQAYKVPHYAPLPKFRCEAVLPFVNIGIDFAGPFYVKANLTSRSQAKLKCYICLFVCATSRALHLELAMDLTTSAFLDIFNRFSARRGLPNLIYSDNGKTFESAAKIIAKSINGRVNAISVDSYFSLTNIKWNFIPPRSP